MILYSAHIFGTGLFIFENFEKKYGVSETWVDNMHLTHSHWFELYISAVYFIIITMITVGFGDIHPVNTPEYIFTVKYLLFKLIYLFKIL